MTETGAKQDPTEELGIAAGAADGHAPPQVSLLRTTRAAAPAPPSLPAPKPRAQAEHGPPDQLSQRNLCALGSAAWSAADTATRISAAGAGGEMRERKCKCVVVYP